MTRQISYPQIIRGLLLRNLHYVAIVLASLVTLTWFRGSQIVMIWDTTLPLNGQSLGVFLYTWHADVSTGISDPSLQMLPYQLIFALGYSVGLSTGIIERAVFVCLMALSGITMYHLAVKRLESKGAALVSGFIYMFNMYAVLYVWREFLLSVFTYALLPLLLSMLHAIMFQKRVNPMKLAGFLIVSLFATIQGPPLLAVLVLGSYAAGSIVLPGKRRPIVGRLVLLSGLWIVANLWWIMPFVVSANNVIIRYGSAGFLSALDFNSQWSTVFNVMRLEGSSVLYGQNGTPSSYSWTSLYESTPNIILVASLLFPLIATAGLMRKTVTRSQSYFAILWVATVAIVAGTQPPFGQVYRFLFGLTPYLLVARDPYLQMGGAIVFSYAILIGYFFKRLNLSGRRSSSGKLRVGSLSAIILIGILVIHPWPVWTGNVIPTAGTQNIPSYYHDAASWLDSQPADYRTLSLPMQDNTLQSYHFPGSDYYGQDILRLLSGRSIISEFTGEPQQENLQRSLYAMFYDNSSYFPQMLAVLNVRFVVVHSDINQGFHTQFSVNKTWAILNQYQQLRPLAQFGPLSFFSDNMSNPMTYVSTHALVATLNDPLGSVPVDLSNWKLTQGDTFSTSASDSVIAFRSSGQYSYAYIQSPLNFSFNTLEHSYILIRFWSEGPASIIANAQGNTNCCFMSAVNPSPATYYGNHYYSQFPYTIAYDLSKMGNNVSRVGIFVSNAENTSYDGIVRLHIVSVSLAGAIGLPGDFNYLFANGLFSLGSDVLTNRSISGIVTNPTTDTANLSVQRVNPTYYTVDIRSNGPFILAFGQQFDQNWQLLLNGILVPSHFMLNGFGNGWYVNATGSLIGAIQFLPQQLAYLGIVGAIIVAILLELWAFAPKVGLPAIFRKRNNRVSTLALTKT